MMRFLRKWPSFKHTSSFDPKTEYKYNISVNFLNTKPENILPILKSHYKFYHIYIDNPIVKEMMSKEYKSYHHYANNLLNISSEEWDLYKKYYRVWEFEEIFVSSPILYDEIILDIDMSYYNLESSVVLSNINDIIHENRNEQGTFECEGLKITINNVTNHIKDNIIVQNPSIQDIRFEIL